MSGSSERILILGGARLAAEVSSLCRESGFTTVEKPGTSGRLRGTYCAFEVTNDSSAKKKKNLQAIERSLPASQIIFSSSITVTVDEQAAWLRHPGRLIGISALPVFFGNKLLELAPGRLTGREEVSEAGTILRRLGKDFRIVQDRIGMVLPRIVCMIINEAAFALMEQVSRPEEIDEAVKLGARYPFGPVELASKIGIPEVIAVLEALHADLGEDRYRVAPLLRQLALDRPSGPT